MLRSPQGKILPALEETDITIMVRTKEITRPNRIEGIGHARTTESLDEVEEPVMPEQEINRRPAARLQSLLGTPRRSR